LLLLPAAVRAEDAPEQLLPATTQLYLRWDGIEPHRGEYDKLALGKVLQGDTGKFVANAFAQFQDLLGSALVQELLQGTSPEKLQALQADALKAPKLVELLSAHGFLLAVEVRGLEPPDGQVTLIFPDAGDKADSFLATVRLAAGLSKQEIKEAKIEGRTVYQLARSPLPVAWWLEGKHLVAVAGTTPPDAVIKGLAAKGPRLPDNPLFQRLHGFKEFPTGTRAFLDVASVTKVAGTRGKEVAQIIADLGLDGVKSLTFYSGLDGATERGLMELETSGTRKGVLRLLDGKPFQLGDVPPLPADAISWTMTNFNARVAFDETVGAVENVVKVVAPDQLPKLREQIKDAEEGLGINLRKDLLDSL